MSLNRHMGRSAACIGTAVVLGVSVLTFAPPSFSTTPGEPPVAAVAASDSDDDGILDARDTASAAAAAAAQDERVEDLSQRTENVSVYANENGTFTQQDFGGAIRVKQSGDWVPVDYTLVKQADGTYAPKASDLDITIDGGSVKEAARVTRGDGTSLAFTWPSNLPEPTVDGGVATYKISVATDLVVTVTGSGVTARIRLNEKPADDDPVFRLGLRADGVNVDQTSTGALKITDEAGRTVGSTTQLSAWDSTTDAAGDPANVIDLDAELGTTSTSGDVTQHTLDLATPEGFLSDPATVYPVTIDPDISMTKTRDTWVRKDTGAKGSTPQLFVGKQNTAETSNSNPSRAYLKFYNGTLEGDPDIDIVSAELGLWQYYAYTCSDRQMNVHAVDAAWNDTITWTNKPAAVSGSGLNVKANRGISGCGDGWTTVDVTEIAQEWALGDIDMQGVRLAASNEEASSYERRFCSMDPDSGTSSCSTAARRPYLSVTYTAENFAMPATGTYGMAAAHNPSTLSPAAYAQDSAEDEAVAETYEDYEDQLEGIYSESQVDSRIVTRSNATGFNVLSVASQPWSIPRSCTPTSFSVDTAAEVSALSGDSCNPDNVRVLNVKHFNQPNYYYCGPASGKMILWYMGKKKSSDGKDKLSMKALAMDKYMKTDSQKQTNFGSSSKDNDMVNGLNTWWGSKKWKQTPHPSNKALKGALRSAVGNGKPLAAGTYEPLNIDTYNNHPTHRDWHHWIVARGYKGKRTTTYYLDPASKHWSQYGVAKKFTAPTSAFNQNYLQTHGIVS